MPAGSPPPRLLIALVLGALLALAGCEVSGDPRDASADADRRDSDGDGILDTIEGRAAGVDSDGDGTPDYLDTDSDDDGIPDMVEAGVPRGLPPIDSDGDGTADFRDRDSDDNGIPDEIEGIDDPDGDPIPAYADPDNDNDGARDLEEIGGDPAMPRDTDGDTIPDYLDLDSDDDTISDAEEGPLDTDMDGTLDRLSPDSDGDGISDADEAGDADLSTPAIDTDRDLRPDYRDLDSDGDGFADALELAAGTDPRDPDTDHDGADDLVEAVAGTDPLDPTDNPRARGDFVFVVPEGAPPMPARDSLDFATDLRRGDVYFLIDTTASMDQEIATLVSDIATTIVPGIRAGVPEAELGVGAFQDYPTSPEPPASGTAYAPTGDVPFLPMSAIGPDDAATIAAIGALALSLGGGDRPEATLPAIHAALTGAALDWPEPPPGDLAYDLHPVPDAPPVCAPDRSGYACFRPDAVPIFVVVTDAPYHDDPGGLAPYAFAAPYTSPSYAETVAALGARHARVVWVDSGDATSRADGARLSTDSGALDGAGLPLVFPIDRTGAGLTTAVVDAIRAASEIPLDVTVRFDDDPSDAVDTRAAFVESIAPDEDGEPLWGCEPRAATDVDGDGAPETFVDLLPGPRVCFDVVPRTNTSVAATLEPQLYRATLTVIGDGFTPLDVRDVYFVVPPIIPEPGVLE